MAPLLTLAGQTPSSLIYHSGNGYFYHLNNHRVNRKYAYMRCIQYRNTTCPCPGTAKALLSQKKMFHTKNHSHEPNIWYPLVKSFKKDIFSRVRNGDQSSFQDIMQEEGQKYPLEVRAQVGMGTILSRLNALRSEQRPPVPRSLGVLGACLLLPQYQYLTKCGLVPESLFSGICGSMATGTLSLVFISTEMKEFMQTRNMIFADGTERKMFRKPHASQIFVLSTTWRFHAIVMARAIMLHRTQLAYEVLFDYFKTLMPNFHPTSIKCDFEDAQLNAWQTKFPHAIVQGCLWHYARAVFSHPKNKLGLYHLVKTESEVSSIIRAAGALPLLPTHEIFNGLNDLGLEAVNKGWMPELKLFFKYMAKEWVPKIPVLSVTGSSHRTNNVAESTNRSFNKQVKVSNPSCFAVLKAFVTLNEKYTVDLHTLANPSAALGRGRKVSALRNDKHIKRLTLDLANGDITRIEFLHKSSRRMQNVFDNVYSN